MQEKWSWGWKAPKKGVWSEKERFRKVKGQKLLTEIERNEIWITRTLFIDSHNSRQIERCREVSSFKGMKRYSYQAAIQRCPQQKEARRIQEILSIYRGDKNFLDGSKSYRNCDKKKLKSSIDKPSAKRCVKELSRSCQDCSKTVFQGEKNTDMNAIKHATQPRIQTTI